MVPFEGLGCMRCLRLFYVRASPETQGRKCSGGGEKAHCLKSVRLLLPVCFHAQDCFHRTVCDSRSTSAGKMSLLCVRIIHTPAARARFHGGAIVLGCPLNTEGFFHTGPRIAEGGNQLFSGGGWMPPLRMVFSDILDFVCKNTELRW